MTLWRAGRRSFFLVGSRSVSLASARNVAPAWQSAMATQPDGVAPLCIRIAGALYELILARRIATVEVVFPVWEPGEGLRVQCRSLLPLDARHFQTTVATMPPLTTLPPDLLLASLAEEYVFASLCEAAMHGFVAENEARAATMVRARGKIQDILANCTCPSTGCGRSRSLPNWWSWSVAAGRPARSIRPLWRADRGGIVVTQATGRGWRPEFSLARDRCRRAMFSCVSRTAVSCRIRQRPQRERFCQQGVIQRFARVLQFEMPTDQQDRHVVARWHVRPVQDRTCPAA